MAFYLGLASRAKLIGVHPELAAVVKRAITITTVDFKVLEGLRTEGRQLELYRAGATKTMNSRHLSGHAVDLGALVDGQVRWDWPLYNVIAEAMKQAAAELHTPIEWGGDWKTFKDGPHFQLPRGIYP